MDIYHDVPVSGTRVLGSGEHVGRTYHDGLYIYRDASVSGFCVLCSGQK
jgi:hypothetical protein